MSQQRQQGTQSAEFQTQLAKITTLENYRYPPYQRTTPSPKTVGPGASSISGDEEEESGSGRDEEEAGTCQEAQGCEEEGSSSL